VVVAGFVVLRLDDADPVGVSGDCNPTRIALSADPRIASVVEEATADLGPWLGHDDCFVLDVVSQPSATTAAEIARPEGVGLSAPLPDLWLPDSSVWLQQAAARAVGAQRLDGKSVSVATSPVVLAVPRREAPGWPARQPSWKTLLAEAEGRRALATTDIGVDAVGLLSLWALTGSSTRQLLGVTRRLAVPVLGDEPAVRLVASFVENDHQGVPDDLVHLAAKALHGGHEPCEVGVEHLGDRCRTSLLGITRIALQVGEQDARFFGPCQSFV